MGTAGGLPGEGAAGLEDVLDARSAGSGVVGGFPLPISGVDAAATALALSAVGVAGPRTACDDDTTGESSGMLSCAGCRSFSRMLLRLGPQAGTKGLGATTGFGAAAAFPEPASSPSRAKGGSEEVDDALDDTEATSFDGEESPLGTARFTSTCNRTTATTTQHDAKRNAATVSGANTTAHRLLVDDMHAISERAIH